MAQHRFRIDNKDYEVDVGAREGNSVQVKVNGKGYSVELSDQAGVPQPAAGTVTTSVVTTAAPKPSVAPPAAGGAGGELRSPMAGLVFKLKTTVGASVSAGQEVMILEAMKMENGINAPISGTVKSIAVEAQQSVAQGDILMVIE